MLNYNRSFLQIFQFQVVTFKRLYYTCHDQIVQALEAEEKENHDTDGRRIWKRIFSG